MSKESASPFGFKNVYPRVRHVISVGRKIYRLGMNLRTAFSPRPTSSKVLPDAYTICNTSNIDSEMDPHCLEGALSEDIHGLFFICQCLGSPEAFMVGNTNIVRLDFDGRTTHLTNCLMWTPAALVV